jgi:hypothetical protein
MSATILEHDAEDSSTEALPTDTEALTTTELVADLTSVDTTAPPEEDIPEKYRGKSMKEVIGMHQSAEALIGKQGSEVGDLRKVVDQYIQSQTQVQAAPPEPIEEVDFFESPEKAVSQAIANHPDVVNARQQAQEMKRSTSLNQLQQKHPDMQSVLQTPAFAEWVQASPVRMELYNRADQGFDFNAADELVSNFKERAAVAQQAVQTETAARQTAVRAASTGSATGTGNAGAKRIYRRADIIKLMKTDPDRYEALNPEIMLAYQEGRVK